jgi:hypothetical protein
VKNVYTKDQVIANMQSHVFPVPRKVHKTTKEVFKPVDLNQPTLQLYGKPVFCEWAIIPTISHLAISAKPGS